LFPDLAKLVACLSMSDDRETRLDLYQSLWQRLISDDTPDSYMVVGSGTESHQISSLALFTEWAIRWNKKHKFTIANVLRTAEFDEVFKEMSIDNAADRYMKFLGVIRSIPDFSTLLTKHKNVSVAIFAKDFIAQSHKLKKDISVNSTSLSTNMAPANEKSVKVEPKDSKSQEQQSGLRKLAGEELTKLYEKAPEKYQSLKRSYVDSLDQSKKQILLELESRSKPQQFDHQIRPSLIRFMVENPAVWSGIKPSRLAPTR
jgi:hypothetical protein